MQAEALALYERLRAADVTAPTRIAAARGIILARGTAGVPLLFEQLAGDDPKGQATALLLMREMPGTDVTEALASQWKRLPPDRQARVITALADRGDPAAVPAVLAALKSDSSPVRLAAAQALGRLGDASAVPSLLAVAARSEGELAEAAVSSLVRLSGKAVDATVLTALRDGDIQARRAAIDVLGRRAYAPATEALIACARSTERPIRLAAVKALGETATASNVPVLVDILVQAQDTAEMAAAETALTTIQARIDEKDACAEALAARLSQSEPPAKQALLRALRRLGGTKAVAAVRAAADDPNAEVQDAALRALCDWPNAEPADDVLRIARESSNEKHRLLAVRGCLRMAAFDELPPPRRVAMIQDSLRLINRDEERRLALGALPRVPGMEALTAVLPFLDSETLKEEAGAAAVAIGEKLLPSRPAPVLEAMEKVLKAVRNQDVIRRATELRTRAR
jgi:HEAT repeat protein